MKLTEEDLRGRISALILKEISDSQRYLGGKDMADQPDAIYTKDVEFDGAKYGTGKKYSSEVYFVLSGMNALGSVQFRGDPYTYEPSAGGKLTVVSAPESKRSKIGTTTSLKPAEGEPGSDTSDSSQMADAAQDAQGEMEVCSSKIAAAEAIGKSMNKPLKKYASMAQNVMSAASGNFNIDGIPLSAYLGWPSKWDKGFDQYAYLIPRSGNLKKIKEVMGEQNAEYLEQMISLAASLEEKHDAWIRAFVDAHDCVVGSTGQVLNIILSALGVATWRQVFEAAENGDWQPQDFVDAIAPVWYNLAVAGVLYPPIRLTQDIGLVDDGRLRLYWAWEKGTGTTGTTSTNGHFGSGVIDALNMKQTWPKDPKKLAQKIYTFWASEDDPARMSADNPTQPIGRWVSAAKSPQSLLI